jgi:hypothetical protein
VKRRKFAQSGGGERELPRQGWMDMQFAAKTISRVTSKPEEKDRRSAKRMATHLKDSRRGVIEHKFQKMPEKVVVWSDTDLVGCRRTRRSPSGGIVMFGSHCVKTHSQTQETIALSSGESGVYGIVKAATIGLGTRGLLGHVGVEVEAKVNTESIAATSIATRRGAGEI